MSTRFGYIPPPYSVFNPPAYYQAMATDPTQIPMQQYPYGGGPYSPYGPWPGFNVGQRTFEIEDAQRDARERAEAAVKLSMTTEDPVRKYITPEGILAPDLVSALKRAAEEQKKPKKKVIVKKKVEKKKDEKKKEEKTLSGLFDLSSDLYLKILIGVSVAALLLY